MYGCDRYREALSARLVGEDPGISEDAIEIALRQLLGLSCLAMRFQIHSSEVTSPAMWPA